MSITLDTLFKCNIPLCDKGTESEFTVGPDINVGEYLSYNFHAADGGYLYVYGANGAQVSCLDAPPVHGSHSTVGGGFAVTDECHKICVGPTLVAYKICYKTVRQLISEASNLDALLSTISGTSLDDTDKQAIINFYFEYRKCAGTGSSTGGGTVTSSLPLSVVDGKLCITYNIGGE